MKRDRQSPVAVVVTVSTAIHTSGAAVVAGVAALAPVLVRETTLTVGDIGSVIGAANVGALPGLVLAPVLVRRCGAGPALALSCVVMAGTAAALTLGPSFPLTLLTVVVFGAAWGLSSVAGGGAVIERSPLRHRGVLSSLRQLGLPAGGVVAGALVALMAWAGWRGVFGALAVVLLVLAVGAARLRVHDASAREGRAWWRDPPWPAVRMGVLSLPLITTQWAFTAYLTLDLTMRLGRGVGTAAAFFLGSQVVGVAARVAFGALSDRLGPPRGPLLAGVAVVGAAALCLFGTLPPRLGDLPVMAVVALVSAAVLGWNGVMILAFAEAGPPGRTTVDIAAGLTVMRVGNIVGPPAFGAALVGVGTTAAWLGLAAVVLLSAPALWTAGRSRTPGGPVGG